MFVPTMNEHRGNIFDEQELDPAATIRKFRTVQLENNRDHESMMGWNAESDLEIDDFFRGAF